MEGELKGSPCGCHACDEGVQPGHFLCSQPSAEMLRREKEGKVVRYLIGGPGSPDGPQRWAWVEVA